ncbi:MAG: OmpA family protein [Nannocystis sp.]|nr:OmpA family protein [Nannocystis sp.]
MPMSIKLLPLVTLLLAPGCVTKTKYNALESELSKTQEELRARDSKIAELNAALDAAIASEQAKVAALEGQLAAAQREKAGLEAAIAKGEGDLAALLKDRARLKDSIADMSRALAEQRKRQVEAEKRIAEYRDMLLRFKGLIEAGKLNVKIVDGRMVLVLPMDILFPSGSAKLNDEGKAALTEVGTVLATIADKRYQVEGHTDNVPIRNQTYANNWELASGRALAVVRLFVEAGVKNELISAASFGEYKPVADNSSEEGKARNRRIEIVIVPDLRNLPGYDELKALAGG